MKTAILFLAAASVTFGQTSRTVQYNEGEIVRVSAKLHFTTMVELLPKTEKILALEVGDKGIWQVGVIGGVPNMAAIKPSLPGLSTSIHLVTDSGRVISLFVVEAAKAEAFDMKVVIDPLDKTLFSHDAPVQPRFVDSAQLEDYKAQAEIAKANEARALKAAKDAKEEAVQQVSLRVAKYREELIHQPHQVYRIAYNTAPFRVSAMWNDGKFTYIQSQAQETPALYESKDGKPNLINFAYSDGLYVADKVLASGWLSIGKKKLPFEVN